VKALGYFMEWLFDDRNMLLSLSYGDILTIGGCGIILILTISGIIDKYL